MPVQQTKAGACTSCSSSWRTDLRVLTRASISVVAVHTQTSVQERVGRGWLFVLCAAAHCGPACVDAECASEARRTCHHRPLSRLVPGWGGGDKKLHRENNV
eukprot:scaffold1026_cov409-Prasinococcus_capsulatus_cf.AAC.27